jgi:hypothetical protein
MTEIDACILKNLREEVLEARSALRKAARGQGRRESTRVVEIYAESLRLVLARVNEMAAKQVNVFDAHRFRELLETDVHPWREYCPYP